MFFHSEILNIMEDKNQQVCLKKNQNFEKINLDGIKLEDLFEDENLFKIGKKINNKILDYINVLKKRINLLNKENFILKNNLKKYSNENISKKKRKIIKTNLRERFQGFENTIQNCLIKIQELKISFKHKKKKKLIIKEKKGMSSNQNLADGKESKKNDKFSFFKKTKAKEIYQILIAMKKMVIFKKKKILKRFLIILKII